MKTVEFGMEAKSQMDVTDRGNMSFAIHLSLITFMAV